jgi:enediyne biosynthesis protein E4
LFSGLSFVQDAPHRAENIMACGVGFFDYQDNGWKDILSVNGHIYPQVNQSDWGTSLLSTPSITTLSDQGDASLLSPLNRPPLLQF